jgi:putative transcriptional regulator
MTETSDRMTVFEQIKAGLEDSIAYSRGELSLATTDLPAPPPKAEPRDVVGLRKSFKMSQAVFAAMLNVSPKTVQSWEQGAREPSDAALRVLQIVRERPDVVNMIFVTRPATVAFKRAATKSVRTKRKRAVAR